MNDIRLAKSLGWFSIALGTLELTMGRRLARMLGLPSPGLVRAFGAREVAAGFGVLAFPDSAGPVWGRVAGDALDLAVLGLALGRSNRQRHNAAWATLAVLGATALDVACAASLNQRQVRALQTAQRTRIA